ncbi:MAG: helix-turn-helix domain-containing protein [Kiloniellales bacterium]
MRLPPPIASVRRFGQAVRETRESQRLSIAELALAAQVPVAELTSLEAGQCLPSAGTILRLAVALDTPPATLCRNVEERPDFKRALDHSRILHALLKSVARRQS